MISYHEIISCGRSKAATYAMFLYKNYTTFKDFKKLKLDILKKKEEEEEEAFV